MRLSEGYARTAAIAAIFGCGFIQAQQTGTALDRYLNGLTSLRAVFTQTVTDGKGKQVESGSGALLVQRPGKFRWDYTPRSDAATASPAGDSQRGQLLVADGKNLWFYDRELAQVTVKPVAAALSATPVMLLTGSTASLRDSFDIAADGSREAMEWVRVKPHGDDADFSAAELGFAHDQIARMIIHDRLGQTVQLEFSHGERNGRVDAAELQFKPPAGVDVIGTPQS
jgi:outer membrane lipoprotein carrier protein